MPGADVIARDVTRAAEPGFFRKIWSGFVRGITGGDDGRPLAQDAVTLTGKAASKMKAVVDGAEKLAVPVSKEFQEIAQKAIVTVRQGKQAVQTLSHQEPGIQDGIREVQNLIYLEARVNDQRYAGVKSISWPANYLWTPDKGPYPQLWAMIPLEDVKIFAKGDKVELPSHLRGIIREVEVPGISGLQKKQFVFFPTHWQQKEIVGKAYPLVEDGLAHVSASVRVVYLDPVQTTALGDFSHTSIKMHLDDRVGQNSPIAGGLGGHRRIDAVWAEMSPIVTEVMEKMVKEQKFSPLVEIMPEAVTMVTKSDRGVIFRTLPEGEVFPAFSIYSPMPPEGKRKLSLKVLGDKAPVADILAIDLLENLRNKNPGMSKLEAIRTLLVDPILDVNLSMFKEGMALELHPQNFLLRFDPQTGRVKSIVCRDLHGFNYSADYRAKKGLPELMSPEALKEMGFPHIQKETLLAYFGKDGTLKDRFKSPHLFQDNLDFFSSMWYFHNLDSLEKSGYLTHEEVLQAVEMVKDRLEFFARQYNFDLSLLKEPAKFEYGADPTHGIRYKVLFRRAAKKS